MTEVMVGIGELAIGHEHETLVALGLGSCVAIVLYDPQAKVGALAHIMLPDSNKIKTHTRPRSVLIADKDPKVRESLKELASHANFEVVGETEDKHQTIEEYSRLRPSVSLVSVFLPPTDGVDTIRSLLCTDPKANIILVSPKINNSVLMNYLNNGAIEVLQNPFTYLKLSGIMEYSLDKRITRFADKAVPIMISMMMNHGAEKERIIARILGGAHMFKSLVLEKETFLGDQNVSAVKGALTKLGVNIVGEETGGSVGRTIRFNILSGNIELSTKLGKKKL